MKYFYCDGVSFIEWLSQVAIASLLRKITHTHNGNSAMFHDDWRDEIANNESDVALPLLKCQSYIRGLEMVNRQVGYRAYLV